MGQHMDCAMALCVLAPALAVFLASTKATDIDKAVGAGERLSPLDWRTGAVVTGLACGG